MSATSEAVMSQKSWPELPYAQWSETCSTLHLWTQIAGKIRLARTPWLNHSWHVALYVTSSGLTTSPIPDGARTFELRFDFQRHRFEIDVSDGTNRQVPLEPMCVADFHAAVIDALRQLDVEIQITELPCEIPDATAFS